MKKERISYLLDFPSSKPLSFVNQLFLRNTLLHPFLSEHILPIYTRRNLVGRQVSFHFGEMLDHIWRRPIAVNGTLMECLGARGGEGSVVFGATGVEADNDVGYFGAEWIGKGYSLALFLISFFEVSFIHLLVKRKRKKIDIP